MDGGTRAGTACGYPVELVLGHYFGEINPSANAALMLSQHRN